MTSPGEYGIEDAKRLKLLTNRAHVVARDDVTGKVYTVPYLIAFIEQQAAELELLRGVVSECKRILKVEEVPIKEKQAALEALRQFLTYAAVSDD